MTEEGLYELLVKVEAERDCYRAARLSWPQHVLEAVARGDVEACRADAKRRHDNWVALEAERDLLTAQLADVTRQRDRLHLDALGSLAKAGICTPEEGYLKAPHCLSNNVADLARERDAANAALLAMREALAAVAEYDADDDDRFAECGSEAQAATENRKAIERLKAAASAALANLTAGAAWLEGVRRDAASAMRSLILAAPEVELEDWLAERINTARREAVELYRKRRVLHQDTATHGREVITFDVDEDWLAEQLAEARKTEEANWIRALAAAGLPGCDSCEDAIEEALAEHDARVAADARRAALEEAAAFTESQRGGFTRNEVDLLHALARELRALALPVPTKESP